MNKRIKNKILYYSVFFSYAVPTFSFYHLKSIHITNKGQKNTLINNKKEQTINVISNKQTFSRSKTGTSHGTGYGSFSDEYNIYFIENIVNEKYLDTFEFKFNLDYSIYLRAVTVGENSKNYYKSNSNSDYSSSSDFFKTYNSSNSYSLTHLDISSMVTLNSSISISQLNEKQIKFKFNDSYSHSGGHWGTTEGRVAITNLSLSIKYLDLYKIYDFFIKYNFNVDNNDSFSYRTLYKEEMFLSYEEKINILKNKVKEFIDKKWDDPFFINEYVYVPNNYIIDVFLKDGTPYMSFKTKGFYNEEIYIESPISTNLFIENNIFFINDINFIDCSKNVLFRYYPDHLISIENNNKINREILDNLFMYESNEINLEKILSTSMSQSIFENDFYMTNILDNSRNIRLRYSDENLISYISNGILTLNLVFGEKINNMFSPGIFQKNVYDIKFKNLKTQFDIYKNNNFGLNLDFNNKSSVNDFYNNHSIDISNKISNHQDIFDIRKGIDENKLKEFIFDELILYDNQNGKRLKESENPNQYILATNLNKEDFESRQIQRDEKGNIQNINIRSFDPANGRVIISFKKLDMGTPWREDKEDINGFSKTLQEIDGGENEIFFALSGFKKHHDIFKRNNTELDASKLNNLDNKGINIGNEINLSNYNPKTIEYAARQIQDNELSFENLLDCLINYEYDSKGTNEQINEYKLLNTFLDEYNFIHKVEPEFIETDRIVRGDVSGTIELNLLLSNQDNALNYNDDIKDVEIDGFDYLKSFYINFKIKGLKQDILLEPIDQTNINDEFDVSLITELKSKTVNEVVEEFNKDKTFILKNIFRTTDNLGNSRNPLFSLNGRMDELYHKNNSVNTNNSIGVIKDIIIEEQNNPMGSLELRIKFNDVNGTFNGINYPTSDGRTSPDDLIIKLNGFKKDIEVSNRIIEIDKNIYNGSLYNQEERQAISGYESINERFILDNLIKYSDYGWDDNVILKTNLKKNEFESYLLSQNNPIEINYDKVNGNVTGTIHLNEHNGTMTYSNSMDSFTNDINFCISGFSVDNISFVPSYNNLDITQYTDNFSKMNLNDFNKSFILEKMIKYSGYNNELSNPILTTNVSKADFVNKYLKDISIVKNNSTKSADVTFTVNDGSNSIREIKCPSIINFEAATSFLVNTNVNHQILVDKRISEIDSNYIIDNLISYQTSLIDSTKIINTNITKEEFVNDYLNKIEFLNNENDLFNNQIKIKMILNKPINNQIEYDFTVYTRTEKSYAIKNNLEFILPKSLSNKNINDVTKEDIKSLIKTNDSNITNYLFALNINKSDLDRYLSFDMYKNEKLGIIEIDFRLLNSGNKSEYDSFKVNLSGFTNQINFVLNNEQIDINWYSVFDSINSLNEIDEDFIINNLIKYEDSLDNSTNIIGSINLTKDEFLKLYDSMEINKNNNKLSVSIKLKNDIKHSKTLSSNTINFQLTDNSIISHNSNSTMIIVLSTIIPIVLIVLIIIFIILIKKYKKKKFNMEVENEI